jgi:hypothetical protein
MSDAEDSLSTAAGGRSTRARRAVMSDPFLAISWFSVLFTGSTFYFDELIVPHLDPVHVILFMYALPSLGGNTRVIKTLRNAVEHRINEVLTRFNEFSHTQATPSHWLITRLGDIGREFITARVQFSAQVVRRFTATAVVMYMHTRDGNRVRFVDLPPATNPANIMSRTDLETFLRRFVPNYTGGSASPFVAGFFGPVPAVSHKLRSFHLTVSFNTLGALTYVDCAENDLAFMAGELPHAEPEHGREAVTWLSELA